MAWMIALHDIGKLHPSFQGLAPALAAGLGVPFNSIPAVRHDTLAHMAFAAGLSRVVLRRLGVEDGSPEWREAMLALQPCIAGHHGRPPLTHDGARPLRPDIDWPRETRPVAEKLALAIADAIGVPDRVLRVGAPTADLARSTWDIAGFVTLCDWVGSDAKHFAFCEPQLSFSEYWRTRALPAAERAVVASGTLPVSPNAEATFQQLFPSLPAPSASQQAALQVPLPAGPILAILEDQTGSGKTEAALALAHRLIRDGRAGGLYFALPTMATANMMHGRLRSVYRNLYAEGEMPSLTLAHGRSPDALGQEDGAVTSTRWLADSRKRALLAQASVGTIDQALLGVLPVRHQSLRLFALADRVLIIDEVHAYDEFMLALLESLLRHHLWRGGSAILLSATLPQRVRDRFVRIASSEATRRSEYPLLTIASGEGVHEVALRSREELGRRVKVVMHHSPEEIARVLRSAKETGQCACWIRNTVADVLEAADLTSALEPQVFHARYAHSDRKRIEGDVVAWSGKEGTNEDRAGRVLIASQVVEQSLDIDFDVLVTDLAPMDLILQRLGRLQRHPRGPRRPPVLHVLAPPWTEDPDPEWHGRLFPRAQHVYEDAAVLWRTQRELLSGEIAVPADCRRLIERSYATEKAPAGLERQDMLAARARREKTSYARVRALNLAAGYGESDAWEDDTAVSTRFGEGTRDCWLAREGPDGELVPLLAGEWDDSRIALPRHWVGPTPTLAKRAVNVLPDDGRSSALIIMRMVGADVYEASALGEKGKLTRLRYSQSRGMERLDEAIA